MALESSASEQEGGGVFSQESFSFFPPLFCSKSAHLFKSSPTSRTKPSGFAPASPHRGMETHSPNHRQLLDFLHPSPPPLQSPIFTVNSSPPEGLFFAQQTTPANNRHKRRQADFGNGLSNHKMNGERGNHISASFPPPSPPRLGKAKASNFEKVPKSPKMGALGNHGNCCKKATGRGKRWGYPYGSSYLLAPLRSMGTGWRTPSQCPSWDTKRDGWGSKTLTQMKPPCPKTLPNIASGCDEKRCNGVTITGQPRRAGAQGPPWITPNISFFPPIVEHS